MSSVDLTLLVGLLVAASSAPGSAEDLDRWHWRNPQPNSIGFEGLAFGHSRFVGIGQGGWILSSSGQGEWSTTYAGISGWLRHVVTTESGFLAFGISETSGVALVSVDGTQWTPHAVEEAGWLTDVALADGLLVGVGDAQSRDSGPMIATSADGLKWTLLDLARLPTRKLNGIAHGNGRWVAVGDQGLILTSTDGLDWNVSESGTLLHLKGVAFGDDRFVAVGYAANRIIGLRSLDGLEWAPTLERAGNDPRSAEFLDLTRIAHGAGGFVAIGSAAHVLFTPDGDTWSEHPLGHDIIWGDVAFGNGQWVAGGKALTPVRSFTTGLSTSTDGRNWTNRTAGVSSVVHNGIAYGNGTYVAVGRDARIATSTNVRDWTLEFSLQKGTELRRVIHAGGRFIALGSAGNTPLLLVSEQGRTWTNRAPAGSSGLASAAFGNGRTIVVGGSTVLLSGNGYDWDVAPSTSASNLVDVIHDGGQFVAVGRKGTIQTSPDGIEWTSRPIPTSVGFRAIAHDGSNYVAVGEGSIFASTNAVDWNLSQVVDADLTAVTSGGGWFAVAGMRSLGMQSNSLFLSRDGRTWSRRDLGGNLEARGLAFDGRTFLVCGASGAILQSDPLESVAAPSLALRWNDRSELVLVGESGRRYTVESTSNLDASLSWLPWATVQAVSNSVRIPAAPSAGVQRQFYRARLEP